MNNRRALGRGLNSLIPDNNSNNKNERTNINRVDNSGENQKSEDSTKVSTNTYQSQESKVSNDNVISLPLDKIVAREGQPRKSFDDEALNDLAASIKEYGLLNPIVVTKRNDKYEILAGERRYRASKKLGKSEIEVIVKEFSDKDVEVLSLVENIQREDLKALEEAQAYKKLANEYNMTQEEIAKTMGKSRSYIANTMRLLNLNDNEKNALNEGKISPSQARTLLSVPSADQRSKALTDFIRGTVNIRTVEENKKSKESSNKGKQGPSIDDILMEDLEEKFMEKLGSKVNIKKSGKSFKVTIDCYDIEDVENIYDKLTKTN